MLNEKSTGEVKSSTEEKGESHLLAGLFRPFGDLVPTANRAERQEHLGAGNAWNECWHTSLAVILLQQTDA